MSSFDGGGKYRYPSYLMRVAPPRVYSGDDLRIMLVPKTYEVRKDSSVIMNQNHDHRRISAASKKSSVDFKDAESTKQNVCEVETTCNNAIDARRKDAEAEVVRTLVDDLSLGQRDLNNDTDYGKNTNKALFGENQCCVSSTTDYDQTSENSFAIPRIEVIDEIKQTNSRNVVNSSMDNSVFYDFDDHEKIYYVNKSSKLPLTNEKDINDKLRLIKICKKCRRGRPVDDFSWGDVSETDKIKLLHEFI